MIHDALLLCFLPAPPPPAPVVSTVHQEDERESLQAFLERMRAEQAAIFAGLKVEVDALIKRLDVAIAGNKARELKQIRVDFAKLGPESAPLLVALIEPGRTPNRQNRDRSQQVAWILVNMPGSSITTELLEIARDGSVTGRRNAIAILAHTSEPRRVTPVLTKIYETHVGDLQIASLKALAQIGGPQNEALLAKALVGLDNELRTAALDAVVDSASPKFAPQVLILAKNIEKAAKHVGTLVAYFRACPEVVDGEHVDALIGLASDPRVATEHRVGVLEAMPLFEKKVDSRAKKKIKQLKDSARREIRVAALVSLAILGDKQARKELLKPLNEQVAAAGAWADPYEDRADTYYKIGDFGRAITDYKQAIKASKDQPRSQPDSFIGLAKCHARLGKLKLAADTLEKAPISNNQLRALADDPAFAELLDSRYARVFRLEPKPK